jgi:hypothetical protein
MLTNEISSSGHQPCFVEQMQTAAVRAAVTKELAQKRVTDDSRRRGERGKVYLALVG